jgi:hypothetical protein
MTENVTPNTPHRQTTHPPTTTTVTNATTPHHPNPSLFPPTTHPTYSSTSTPHAPSQRINFPPRHLPCAPPHPGPSTSNTSVLPGHLLAMCAATQRAMMRASQAERACGRPDAMRAGTCSKQAQCRSADPGRSWIRPVTVRTHKCRSAKPLPCCCCCAAYLR